MHYELFLNYSIFCPQRETSMHWQFHRFIFAFKDQDKVTMFHEQYTYHRTAKLSVDSCNVNNEYLHLQPFVLA